MPKILLFAALVVIVNAVNGQRVFLKGKVVDSMSGKGLTSATISLVKAADSALLTFGVADSAGGLRLEAVGRGPFLISISYTGYQPVWKTVTGGVEELGEIELVPLGLLQ